MSKFRSSLTSAQVCFYNTALRLFAFWAIQYTLALPEIFIGKREVIWKNVMNLWRYF